MSVSAASNNIGGIYKDQGVLDTALTYFLHAEKLKRQLGNFTSLPSTLINIGRIYLTREENEKAKVYFKEALEISSEVKQISYMATAYDNLADIFRISGKLDSASIYLAKGLDLSRKSGNMEVEMVLLEGLITNEKKLGRFELAIGYLEAYHILKDSLTGLEKSVEIAALQTEFETAKKDIENDNLKKKEALQDEIIERQEQLNIIVLIGSGLLGRHFHFLHQCLGTKKEKGIACSWPRIRRLNPNENLWNLQKMELIELSREKDGLLGIVVHDLKAPLVKVRSLVELLRNTDPEAQPPLLDMLDSVAFAGEVLIKDLLDITVAEQGDQKVEMAPIVVDQFVEEFVRPHIETARRKDIEIHATTSPESFSFMTNKDVFSRVLDNLVTNAIKFSEKESKVYLTFEKVGVKTLVKVRDEGPGISPEDQKKMFRKFQKLSARPTAGESSTGLGLSIVKTLTEKLGGTVSFESELGRGTQFTLEFL